MQKLEDPDQRNGSGISWCWAKKAQDVPEMNIPAIAVSFNARRDFRDVDWIFSLTLDSSKERDTFVELIHEDITESLYIVLGKRPSELKIPICSLRGSTNSLPKWDSGCSTSTGR